MTRVDRYPRTQRPSLPHLTPRTNLPKGTTQPISPSRLIHRTHTGPPQPHQQLPLAISLRPSLTARPPRPVRPSRISRVNRPWPSVAYHTLRVAMPLPCIQTSRGKILVTARSAPRRVFHPHPPHQHDSSCTRGPSDQHERPEPPDLPGPPPAPEPPRPLAARSLLYTTIIRVNHAPTAPPISRGDRRAGSARPQTPKSPPVPHPHHTSVINCVHRPTRRTFLPPALWTPDRPAPSSPRIRWTSGPAEPDIPPLPPNRTSGHQRKNATSRSTRRCSTSLVRGARHSDSIRRSWNVISAGSTLSTMKSARECLHAQMPIGVMMTRRWLVHLRFGARPAATATMSTGNRIRIRAKVRPGPPRIGIISKMDGRTRRGMIIETGLRAIRRGCLKP